MPRSRIHCLQVLLIVLVSTNGFQRAWQRNNRLHSVWPSSLPVKQPFGRTHHGSNRIVSLQQASQPNHQKVFQSKQSPLMDLLYRYDFRDRLITLPRIMDKKEGPFCYVAEIYRHGAAEMVQLEEFVWPDVSSADSSAPVGVQVPWQEPKVVVRQLSQGQQNMSDASNSAACTSFTIDLGQITTIWCNDNNGSPRVHVLESMNWQDVLDKAASVQRSSLEKIFDRIYASTVRKGRTGSRTLTKKSLGKEATAAASRFLDHHDMFDESWAETIASHYEQVLRKVQKTGSGFARLEDSKSLAHHMNSRKNSKTEPEVYRVLASILLARDANEGGRFKRWPTVMVEHDPTESTVTLINGGWLVLDQSVRAGLEAEKMVSRMTSGNSGSQMDADVASDDRILRRLECLAMGEVMFGSDLDEDEIHLDVKRTLSTMKLPCTPQGAQEALLQLGRWDTVSSGIQPWPSQILDAASQYANIDQGHLASLEKNRVDLTNLPCICVDAKGTTFRDDALGIRPRQKTGRRFDPEVSKWEVLIHITDVSDIYAGQPLLAKELQQSLVLLKDAAQSRGTSRYDLPFGPLHLMPPVALSTLGFSDKKQNGNRAVTIWAYIDESDGRVVDAGIERTIVSNPITLSYRAATSLIESTGGELDPSASKVRVLLMAIEKSLKVWQVNRQSRSRVALQRETRLNAKENAVRKEDAFLFSEEDDDPNRFQRTSSHRLVDAALDLYAYCGRRMLNRARAPIPFSQGAGLAEGGRLATAPLRRYIDGECQRQLLATCLGYGKSMDAEECRRAGKIANDSRNKIRSVRALRNKNNVRLR